MDELFPPSAEHESIATSLEVEQLDKNLYVLYHPKGESDNALLVRFRSKTLYLPKGARGVFGGQV